MATIEQRKEPIESAFDYKRTLLGALSKFGHKHTLQIAIEEIRRLMQNDITDNDRMIMFLTALSDTNEYMKPQQKKEQIKIYGVAAEIFREDFIPFISKILSIFQKKIKEHSEKEMQEVYAEALGEIVFHVATSTETFEQQLEFEKTVLALPYSLLNKSTNPSIQGAGALCLSKVVHNTPEHLLEILLEEISDNMLSTFKSKEFKNHNSLLNTLISIIFQVETLFQPHAAKFVPVIFKLLESPDWTTKKVCIDAVLSMSAILKEQIIPFRMDFLRALKPSKVHKQKPVREAALGTIMQLKEMYPPLSEAELLELGEIVKKERKPVLGERSPRSKQSKQEEIQKKQFDSTLVLNKTFEDQLVEKSTGSHAKLLVSSATLKRRASIQKREVDEDGGKKIKKRRNTTAEKNKSRKPIFERKMNANFFTSKDEEITEEPQLTKVCASNNVLQAPQISERKSRAQRAVKRFEEKSKTSSEKEFRKIKKSKEKPVKESPRMNNFSQFMEKKQSDSTENFLVLKRSAVVRADSSEEEGGGGQQMPIPSLKQVLPKLIEVKEAEIKLTENQQETRNKSQFAPKDDELFQMRTQSPCRRTEEKDTVVVTEETQEQSYFPSQTKSLNQILGKYTDYEKTHETEPAPEIKQCRIDTLMPQVTSSPVLLQGPTLKTQATKVESDIFKQHLNQYSAAPPKPYNHFDLLDRFSEQASPDKNFLGQTDTNLLKQILQMTINQVETLQATHNMTLKQVGQLKFQNSELQTRVSRLEKELGNVNYILNRNGLDADNFQSPQPSYQQSYSSPMTQQIRTAIMNMQSQSIQRFSPPVKMYGTQQFEQSPKVKQNQSWSSIQSLLQRNMHDEAFTQVLRQHENEDMLLIRTIGKVGSFSVEKLTESVRTELFKRSISLIENGEFCDTFLPCFQEAIESHRQSVSPSLCQYVSQQFAQLREADIERSLKGLEEKFSIEQRAKMGHIVKIYQEVAQSSQYQARRPAMI